jgi:dTDP-4-amino-4,6-dideoxygalactose transaminase
MIPLLDLKRQYQSIKNEIDARLREIIESGTFILGPQVKSLEEEMAKFCAVSHAVGVASGTDALELALRAVGIAPGDEVITTPFTFIATTEAISQVGAKIVFADIDSTTYTIDPRQIRAYITKKTKAIIPVHLYGQPCAMDEIMALAREHDLCVVEDCAQALGAAYRGTKVGSFGDAGCLSFFPTKNLGGYGDGGMVVTKSGEVAENVLMLRAHGSKQKYIHLREGRNSRLDEIQAGVLRIKLKYLDAWNEQRRQRARMYGELFSKSGLKNNIIIPKTADDVTHAFALYTVRARKRDALRAFLQSKDIATAVHYPMPLHLQDAYKALGYKKGDFPHAESVARQVISLPLYPEMTKEEIEKVAEAIEEFYKEDTSY